MSCSQKISDRVCGYSGHGRYILYNHNYMGIQELNEDMLCFTKIEMKEAKPRTKVRIRSTKYDEEKVLKFTQK